MDSKEETIEEESPEKDSPDATGQLLQKLNDRSKEFYQKKQQRTG